MHQTTNHDSVALKVLIETALLQTDCEIVRAKELPSYSADHRFSFAHTMFLFFQSAVPTVEDSFVPVRIQVDESTVLWRITVEDNEDIRSKLIEPSLSVMECSVLPGQDLAMLSRRQAEFCIYIAQGQAHLPWFVVHVARS